MTKASPKDVGASVRNRLSRLARERGEDFQLLEAGAVVRLRAQGRHPGRR